MWAMLAGAGIGAGMGMAKQREASKQAHSDRVLAANTALYSPWTGLKAEKVNFAPSTLSQTVGGAMSGMSMGQNMQGAANGQAMQAEQLEMLKRKNQQEQMQQMGNLAAAGGSSGALTGV